MRAALAVIGFTSGCSKLLGISDPGGDGGPRDGGADAEIDSSIDAPPPCTTPTAFGAEMSFDIGRTGTSFAVAELNFIVGGGRDVVIAQGDRLQIMAGDGTGGFTKQMEVPLAAQFVLADDFDDDGDSDLILWTENGSSIVESRQDSVPNPSAFLAAQPLPGTFGTVKRAALGIIDGDFRSDVAVYDVMAPTRGYTSNLGTPGTFSAGQVVPGVSGTDVLVDLRDIDGLSRDDAVFFTNGTVKVAYNSAGFGNAVVIGSVTGGTSMGFGKFIGGDAMLDLIIGAPDGGHLFQQTSPGVFQAVPGTIPEITGNGMQVLDVNGDGTDDVVVDNRIVLQCPTGGTFTQVEGVNAVQPSVLVDINKNTKPDLLRLEGTTLKVRVQ